MADAPWIRTFVAVALIPVAFFFTHAYLSGRKRGGFHKVTGVIAVVWDLSLSVFYMIFRLLEGEAEGGVLDINPELVTYFAIRGLVAAVVIVLEVIMLATGLYQWKAARSVKWHRRLALPLYVLWFGAFLSGEIVYPVYYVL